MVHIQTKYDYETRPSPGINFSPKTVPADRSLTNQADLKDSDINVIMAKYEKTGVLIDPLGFERKPVYGDFTQVQNYHEMMVAIKNVERAFDTLPAKTKNRFQNDPQRLVDFLADPANDAEAVELGFKDRSILPQPPVWDKTKQKWTDAKDGSVLADQPAPPANPPAPAAPVPGQPANPVA